MRFTTKSLGELATFKSGGTPRKSKPDYWGGPYPWISAKDMKSVVVNDSIDKLTDEGFRSAKVAPKDSLLILVRGMTLHKDVPVCLVGKDVAFNQDIKALTPNNDILPRYLLHVLRAEKYRMLRLIDSAGHGTGRFDTEILKAYPISYPSIDAQYRLVEVASLWDDVIEKTEQLISAKEKQFAALTQSLISQQCGKTKGRWPVKHLGDVFAERTENNRGDLPLLSITRSEGIIPHGESGRKDSSNKDKAKYLRVCPGDIAYNTMRMWQGVSALSKLEGIVSPAYTVCIPSDEMHADFVAHYFKTPWMIHQFYRYSQGLTSDTWNLKFRHFREIKASIPPLEEQIQIANILNTARDEIKLLKQQAELYRQQKRGLMQKLLTGEWRVKANEAAA